MDNAIRSTKSDKTMATAAGTFVVRRSVDSPVDAAHECSWLDALIKSRQVLRQVGSVEHELVSDDNDQLTGVIELRCRVEYGPVFGAYESDLTKQLARICANDASVVAFDVFDFKRTELRASVAELQAKVNDIKLSLEERKRYENILRAMESNASRKI